MGYPRFRRARTHKLARRTSGNIIASTSWANVDTALDLTLDAQVGDVIEYGVSGLWNNDATNGFLDVGTLVSSAIVNTFGNQGAESAGAGDGVQAWWGPSGVVTPIGGSVLYALQSGDISNGLVTLRLRFRCNTGSKTLYGAAANHLSVFAKNLGPVDPN